MNLKRLHKVGYFTELMSGNEEIDSGRFQALRYQRLEKKHDEYRTSGLLKGAAGAADATALAFEHGLSRARRISPDIRPFGKLFTGKNTDLSLNL